MVWGIIYLAFGIRAPSSVSNMFGSLLEGLNHNIRNIVLLGAASICWALWLTRNDFVFREKRHFPVAGYVCHFPLAPYTGDAAEGGSVSYGCAGEST
jgi:hypothetical protein